MKKQPKNFLVITAVLLIDIAVGFQWGAVKAKADDGLVVTTAIDVIFANLGMTILDFSLILLAIALLVISTMIKSKKEN